MIRLFSDILGVIPPPPLVDAICRTLDTAVRRPGESDVRERIVVAEEINTAYVTAICTPALAKALCDLLALGGDYASPALFHVLRYVVDSEHFKALSSRNALELVHLCQADEDGRVRRAAQELRAQSLLSAYTALSFPKPDFPLDEECFMLRNPAALAIEGASIVGPSGDKTEPVLVFPSVQRVCCCSFCSLTPTA
jgi:hypothetical protein